MNTAIEQLKLEVDVDRAIELVTNFLTRLSFQVVPSFDLRAARTVHARFNCPRHGSAPCDCQMVVLLLYGRGEIPTTLVVHGYDGMTFLSLVNTPQQRPEADLSVLIHQALIANVRAS